MGFWPVLKKNFRIMFNSKLSILILIFGPLFLMGIMGAALQNNELRDIQASVFSHEESIDYLLENDWYVDSYLDQLRQNSFIVRQVNSINECKDDVLNSRAHVCIEVVKKPPIKLPNTKFSQDINYETQAYVDFSKSRIVWGVIAKTQAVSESHSKVLVQNVLVQYKEKLEQPMNDLRGAYAELDNALVLLDNIDSNLNSAKEKQDQLNADSKSLNIAFGNLKSKVQTTVSTVNKIAGLDSSIYNSVNELNTAFQETDAKYQTLYSKLNMGDVLSSINNAQSFVSQVDGNLRTVKNKIDNVLEVWNGISQMNYADLAPLSFSYQSVTEDSQIKGTVSRPRLEFLDYLFPSFLMFFIIFVSLVFATVTTFKERSSKAHIRNVTSRTSAVSFILGNFISIFFILALQIAVILGVSVFFLRASILANSFPLVAYSFIGIVLFALLGIALGYIFNSQDGAVIASVSLSLLFLIFLPVITAPETLPLGFSKIVNVMPFVILESKLRLASIFNIFSVPSALEFLSLACSFLVSVILIFYFYYRRRRLEI
ncbi:ABC transporter permease [Candidatus Pacearchaeota archaeon]|nr:ABC transporter permease [Candidatus Pacearchaeota archaeon]